MLSAPHRRCVRQASFAAGRSHAVAPAIAGLGYSEFAVRHSGRRAVPALRSALALCVETGKATPTIQYGWRGASISLIGSLFTRCHFSSLH